jgi:hypothetical protein
VVERLASVAPRLGDGVSLRELGLVTLGIGAFLVSCIGPALLLVGQPAKSQRLLRATSRANTQIAAKPALSRTSLGGQPS